jgi:hypothetical protein
MTPQQKLARAATLVRELQHEENEAIVEARIAGLAKELDVSPFQCALMYQTLKMQDGFKAMFGNDVKVRFRAR